MQKHSLDCEQHKDCEVEYFCVDHDELCCRDCLAKTHKSCVNTCVNWDGTEVFSYKIPNEEGHRKIVMDRNGNVYSVGYHTNTIQRLHSNGTVDCVVLSESDGVKETFLVCFNKSCYKLHITNYYSGVVHVYSCS